ncbi:MAG: phosphate ABC transporter ATP-binding protein [Firmicutes bacterium]|nr:phosphate ABC transporter ATP-binding protein [Bacillota bacterium]
MAARQINAFYSRTQILHDVSLAMNANAVTAIIGPTGCGKSTFLRCLNRMHETVAGARMTGRVVLGSTDLYAMDAVEVRRTVGMVFDRPNPFPTLSIFDNVAAGLRLNGIRQKDLLIERVQAVLSMTALWDEVKDRLEKPAIHLQSGQQQRLCLARALALEPAVVLLDEPASTLDPSSTLQLEELIEQLKDRYTVVLVTHNLQQAARVADTTAFFLDGHLIETGRTIDIFTNPSDTRTEDYITGRRS